MAPASRVLNSLNPRTFCGEFPFLGVWHNVILGGLIPFGNTLEIRRRALLDLRDGSFSDIRWNFTKIGFLGGHSRPTWESSNCNRKGGNLRLLGRTLCCLQAKS